RVLAGLAQEELERVRRRLDGLDGGRRRRGLLLLLLGLLGEELDPAPVELGRLEQLDELLLAQLAARLGGLEQSCQLLVDEDGLDLDGQLFPLTGPLGFPWA